MKVATDTNVLAYAEGIDDPQREKIAQHLIDAIPSQDLVIPVQVLGELFQVLCRKGKFTRTRARDAMLEWHQASVVVGTTPQAFLQAGELATRHDLNSWDAVILSVASQAGCRLLLSEDMQDGFTWGGVTIVNPFAEKPNPLLAALLEPPAS
ncbi:PIN domain-containing protein [Mesorhizobium sp. KR9-304]|uniref:PIN domain-containing protein n=1 Tax=Mesorhizobium sp. KR9-304 TaxID=3156614 RepID=UPI0032B4D8EE